MLITIRQTHEGFAKKCEALREEFENLNGEESNRVGLKVCEAYFNAIREWEQAEEIWDETEAYTEYDATFIEHFNVMASHAYDPQQAWGTRGR